MCTFEYQTKMEMVGYSILAGNYHKQIMLEGLAMGDTSWNAAKILLSKHILTLYQLLNLKNTKLIWILLLKYFGRESALVWGARISVYLTSEHNSLTTNMLPTKKMHYKPHTVFINFSNLEILHHMCLVTRFIQLQCSYMLTKQRLCNRPHNEDGL